MNVAFDFQRSGDLRQRHYGIHHRSGMSENLPDFPPDL